MTYTYDPTYHLLGFVLILIIFGFLYMIFLRLIEGTKSKQYRRLLTDLYVAGRIRQFAKEDDIDLTKEFKMYKKVEKIKLRNLDELDETVERELQEKIQKDKDLILDLSK